MSKNYMGGGKVCSHGSGLEPFLLGALHAKIPGKELSKGGEGGGTNRQFREGRNKGEEKGDQKNQRARDLLIKQHREVPESWPRRRTEGEWAREVGDRSGTVVCVNEGEKIILQILIADKDSIWILQANL